MGTDRPMCWDQYGQLKQPGGGLGVALNGTTHNTTGIEPTMAWQQAGTRPEGRKGPIVE